MINDILTGLPWGIFLSFMIGPVFFILIETSITKGFRAALAFDLGVVLADVVFILIAFSISFLYFQLPQQMNRLPWPHKILLH